MAAHQAAVSELYRSVIEEVLKGVRKIFSEEGVNEAVLFELKENWENKLLDSRVIDPVVSDPVGTSFLNKFHYSKGSAGNHSYPANASQSDKSTAQSSVSIPSPSESGSNLAPTADTSEIMVPVQLYVPRETGVLTADKYITVLVPANAIRGTAVSELHSILNSVAVTAALSLPVDMATKALQQHINSSLKAKMKTDKTGNPLQVDGINDSSDDDEDESLNEDDIEEENDENDIEKQIYEKDNENGSKSDGPVLIEKPLNSEDDDDDDSTSEHSDSENIITCQYEKVTRSRNKWKFNLKDGIMNINGRNYVFHKATGDAHW